MQKNKPRKCLIVGIVLLFFLMCIYPNYALRSQSDITINNGLVHLALANEYNQPKIDLQFRDVRWNATFLFNESDGANDYTVFGEAPDANDGPPADIYDVPKPPSPSIPYIWAWFNDNLSTPYNLLMKDYRHYPDNYKQWNLSIIWGPVDGVTPTNVTISWNISELYNSEYSIIKLYDSNVSELVNMLAESNYTFSCPAMIPQIFYIICQTVNSAPETPEKPSGETQCNINVEYSYSTITSDMDGDQIYFWFEWGDGTNSGWTGPYDSGTTNSLNHTWTADGEYQIKVKAKDTSDAESPWSDPLTVTVDSTPPTIKIIKPVKGLYFMDKMIRRFLIRIPFIIGRIAIEVNATDNGTGINKVEFYAGLFGNKLLGNDTEAPYSFLWKRDRIRFIHLHILKVVAYDNVGNTAFSRIIVHKFL